MAVGTTCKSTATPMVPTTSGWSGAAPHPSSRSAWGSSRVTAMANTVRIPRGEAPKLLILRAAIGLDLIDDVLADHLRSTPRLDARIAELAERGYRLVGVTDAPDRGRARAYLYHFAL